MADTKQKKPAAKKSVAPRGKKVFVDGAFAVVANGDPHAVRNATRKLADKLNAMADAAQV